MIINQVLGNCISDEISLRAVIKAIEQERSIMIVGVHSKIIQLIWNLKGHRDGIIVPIRKGDYISFEGIRFVSIDGEER